MTAIHFHHGLGDCANFAFQIPLYTARGHEIRINCTPDKDRLFAASGAVIDRDSPTKTHGWWHAPPPGKPDYNTPHAGNKSAVNISAAPMPNVGSYTELWDEYINTRIDTSQLATDDDRQAVDQFLEGIDQPIILVHTKGNTSPESKNLDDETTLALYRELIDQTDAVLILLDWDSRVPWFHSYRVRHLIAHRGGLSLPELYCLMERSSVVIGIDSGVQHFARISDTPVIGLWTHHYPSHFALPSPKSLHIVPDDFHETTRFRRWDWNVMEAGSGKLNPQVIASAARHLIVGRTPRQILLDSWIDRCRGQSGALSDFIDRHRSFELMSDFLYGHENPVMVETGTIRAPEDWSGAGYSTYLFGALLSELAGTLHSVDLDPANVAFAASSTQQLPAVECHLSRGDDWLRDFEGRIDLLYLDSCDTDDPNHADVCLDELIAGLAREDPPEMIVIDDTVWDGEFKGKGAKAVPYLLERQWRVTYSGYQTVLSAPTTTNQQPTTNNQP